MLLRNFLKEMKQQKRECVVYERERKKIDRYVERERECVRVREMEMMSKIGPIKRCNC